MNCTAASGGIKQGLQSLESSKLTARAEARAPYGDELVAGLSKRRHSLEEARLRHNPGRGRLAEPAKPVEREPLRWLSLGEALSW